jgi:hypothetical protein
MSPAQISQIHEISTEQIPIFSLIWKEQINFAREEGGEQAHGIDV